MSFKVGLVTAYIFKLCLFVELFLTTLIFVKVTETRGKGQIERSNGKLHFLSSFRSDGVQNSYIMFSIDIESS